MPLVVLALTVLFGAWPSASQALGGLEEADNLKDLLGVGVVVEEMNRVLKREGVRTDHIQTEVKVRLRMAGIRVLGSEVSAQMSGAPYLYVNVNAKKVQDLPLYLFAVRLELHEVVSPVRKQDEQQFAVTWRDHGVIGNVGADHVGDILLVVSDEVDRFVKAYRAANPQ